MFSQDGSSPLYKTGFLGVQQALSQAHIKHKCKQRKKCQDGITFPKIRDLPSPPIFKSTGLDGLGIILILIIVFFVVISLSKSIVEEKELQLKEIQNLLGVGSGLQWLAWYVQNFIVLLIGSTIITLCWKIKLPTADLSFLPFTHWSIFLFALLIFCHSMICLSFLMSSLISSTHRITLIVILILFATKIPFWIFCIDSCSEGLGVTISIFILSALELLSKGLSSWEDYGVGLQWDNLFLTSWPGDTISVGYILLVMLLTSLLSLVFCLYMEQIRPGIYGVSRPWNFPCTCCSLNVSFRPYKRLFCRAFGIYRAQPDEERADFQRMEPDPESKTVGVQIKGLSKIFGKMEVVKHMSFSMFEGQITVLMGHNGAGKTTLISMLAGFISPTSGTALVNGYDIRKQRRQAQSCIGLCPQQNVLFRHLSSASHIQFFSRLRGLRGAEVKAEVDKYLEKLDLQKKKKSPAHNLSGGMQRKLSFVCSVCGGVKVLICDEPSTGLDPSARREIWKLILEAKEGCTILLTTHQLDDGEVLGDRMVIISDGQLRCVGSLPFLKKLVDANCLLTCETRKRCDVERLTSLISRHVGDISPFSIKGKDVCYKLPLNQSKSFSPLFRDLENKRIELGIRGFGLSSVSLEEIFMSFGAEDLGSRMTGGAEKQDDGGDDDDDDEDEDQFESNRYCVNQWWAVMTKKILSLYANKAYFLLLLSLPIIYYLTTLTRHDDPKNLGRMTLNVGLYLGDGATLLLSQNKSKSKAGLLPSDYVPGLIEDGIQLKLISEKVEDYVRDALMTKEGKREISFMPMAVSIEDPLIGWVGPRHYIHAAPMTINLVYNILAYELFGPKIAIEVTSSPFKKSTDDFSDISLTPTCVLCYVCIVMIMFSNSVIQENVSHMKMQQEVAGLGMITYWLSHLLFDLLVYFILVLALMLPLYTLAPWDYLLLVLFFTGLAGLIFTYFLILAFSASLLAVSLILLSALVAVVIVYIVEALAVMYNILEIVIYVFHIHPMIACYFCIEKCVRFSRLCRSTNSETLVPEIAAQLDISCIKPSALIIPGCVCENPMTWPEMIVMLCGAFIFCIFILFIEYGSCIWYGCKGCCFRGSRNSSRDVKIAREAEKIKNMNKDQIGSRALVVDQVSKKYACGPLAVDNISFALKSRTCLGLLGPNGAGKTSTFKMIVGEHSMDRGNIYITGFSMKKKRNKALREIGYCPQNDSFFEFFTGRQMLNFFLLIRGTERKELKERSEQLADQFGFRKHLDKRIMYYSGGTKRKIDAAVACRAKSLICLDEPSAGVDPASRRHVWTIIDKVVNKGKAVLLTSHNMDEINALCSKSVILVDGKIYTMGSNQHIKNTIAKGMVVKLIVNEQVEEMPKVLLKIEVELKKTCPNAILKEKYEFSGRLTFLISEEESSWSQIFNFIEGNRISWNLNDYSISQPSLEDVFEEIAKDRTRKKTGY
ncbi:phospholipid-transporting ATPase ABCA1 [Drosophila eugracilis]|uniref:phospholipid-transporting ATPase ABCA1 n=1 Tax=Drosophila eugracilis TaxID=29029 RepID=UPI0007E74DEB|nr:phospholipid-transporting ATPase ABCA1 [Drosophila eugracilis]